MSHLMVKPFKVKLQFYCTTCDIGSIKELLLADVLHDSFPCCIECDYSMELEWIMVPTSDAAQENQI